MLFRFIIFPALYWVTGWLILYGLAVGAETCWEKVGSIRDTRIRKRGERAYGQDHPLTITTLDGNKHVVPDWGTCKDLRAALAKVAPELGKPSTLVLFGGSSTDGLPAHRLDPLYGSEDRAQMLAGEITTELSLVIGRGNTGGSKYVANAWFGGQDRAGQQTVVGESSV